MSECEYAFDHESGETCEHCGLVVDRYCNTEADRLNCSFPDCGCDGARLCDAPSGANDDAVSCNVEGMYQRKDRAAIKGRLGLYGLVLERGEGDA